jgi:hypothetical protein
MGNLISTFYILIISTVFQSNILKSQDTDLPKEDLKIVSHSELTEQKLLKEHYYKFPIENSVVFHKEIHLSWNNDYKNNRLQVSLNRNFSEIVIDTIVKTKKFIIPDLHRHKTYYWRVIEDKPTYLNDDEVTFFKTTSIIMDQATTTETLEIIPAWMDEMALLYIDNPNHLKYEIKIYNQKNELVANKSSRLEKFAIETESWPKGDYKMHVVLNNNKEHSKNFSIR